MMIAAILTFCCNPAMQAQNAVLTLDDVELKAGEVKELEINLTNPIPVTYVGADIILPEGCFILPEGCSFEQYYNEEDEEYYDLEQTSRKHSSHSVSTNHIDDAPNHLRFVMFSMKNSNIKGNDGALIKFKIRVGKDMQLGKYEIQIAKQDIVTADSQQANELGYTTKSALTIKPNEFTVTIKDAANGTVTGAGTYPVGSEVTLIAMAGEGYKFVKWSNEFTNNPYKFNITEDVELSAIFEACKYTITYVVDGETYKTIEVAFGAKITPEAAPEKEGYKFSGWNEIPETMPSKDVTVTGSFIANVYTVTYVVDGETYKTAELSFGAKITPEAAPEKEGYKFSGWSEMPETMPSKDVTVTGSFIANVYTITYVVDGETYKTAELSFGEKITPEAVPEKEGYKFSGWSEIPETMPSKDITVTGTFAANVYTITYVVDGATYKTAELSFGEKITPEAVPEKEGYKFSGWSEMPETMPAKDITVTGTFEIIIAINEIISSDKKVDVYNKNGIRIYKQVYVKEVLQRLPKGIYFISGRKIYVQ